MVGPGRLDQRDRPRQCRAIALADRGGECRYVALDLHQFSV